MRKYILYIMCLLLPLPAGAQLTDGSFAPDFALQDLNGQTWQLYELLDHGKNVIIDFSATWCDPCWSYHASGVLNEVYASYGPEGTDEYMVFLIEGDPSTELECLYDPQFCSNVTLGDWTEGTLYPIINDDFIASTYNINYWPTLYHICPNKIVTELNHPDAATIYALKDACPVVFGDNNASVVEYVAYSGLFCGSISLNPTIKVQNLGQEPMVSATVECYVNDVLQETFLWTGHVNTYASFLLSLNSLTITADATIMVRITSVNGVVDEDLTNNETTAKLILIDRKDQNILQLELTTGYSPGAAYWELTNSENTVLYKAGNQVVIGKDYVGTIYTKRDSTYITELLLPGDGCYQFSIYDLYGNGRSVNSYKISDPNGDIVVEGDSIDYNEIHLIGIDSAVSPIATNGAIVSMDGVPKEFCREVEYAFSATLLNLGIDSIHQAEIEVVEDGNILEVINWEGTILPGHSAVIPLTPTSLVSGDIMVRIISVNGMPDVFDYQNEWQAKLERNPSADHVLSLELQLDNWAYETYWQLSASSGEVLYSGGNTQVGPDGGGLGAMPNDPGAYDPNELVQIDMVLPDSMRDCYEFLLVDAYGDGITTYGHILLTEQQSGKEVAFIDYGQVVFEREEIIMLDVTPKGSSTKPLTEVDDFELYPNPAQSEIQVRFETNQTLPLTLALVNSVGEAVLHFPEKEYAQGYVDISIDVSVLPSGIYFLHLLSGNKILTRKVTVMR